MANIGPNLLILNIHVRVLYSRSNYRIFIQWLCHGCRMLLGLDYEKVRKDFFFYFHVWLGYAG